MTSAVSTTTGPRPLSQGLIRKTEADYPSVVMRLLTKMRLDGELPFSWIADNTR